MLWKAAGAFTSPERHDLIILLSISCTKACLMMNAFLDLNKVISAFYVEDREHFTCGIAVSEFIHER